MPKTTDKRRGPLGSYLKKHDLNQEDFAKLLSVAWGSRVDQPQVSKYGNARVIPSRVMQEAIGRATNGEVMPGHWRRWVAQFRSKRSRRPRAAAR